MRHLKSFISYVEKKINNFHHNKEKLEIIIAGTNDSLAKGDIRITRTIDNLLNVCKKYNLHYRYYLDENDFIKAFFAGEIDAEKAIVYNRTTRGPANAKRMLIPAFCALNDIYCLGNDAYRMGLLCSKFHYSAILRSLGISVPDFWCFCPQSGWLNGNPPNGLKVIAKLVNENNKVSLTCDSVNVFSKDFEFLVGELAKKYNQPVIVQKFITGYEITIPVFIDNDKEVIIPKIFGIYSDEQERAGSKFMLESDLSFLRDTDCEKKYFDFEKVNDLIADNIRKDSVVIAKALGIKGFSRFDLRIDDSYDYYFIDLGSMPGILPSCSFEYVFKEFGFTYEDFLITTMCLD